MSSVRLIMTVCFSTLLIAGCSEKEVDIIADAQSCLDTATKTTAAACVSKVDGIETPGAYLIRCVGKFVEEGLNEPVRLKAAIEAVDADGGSSSSINMMTVLAFKESGVANTNQTNAKQTFQYCNQSNSKGLILFASLAQTATTVASLGGVTIDPNNPTGSAAALEAAMNTLQNDPVAQNAVGEAAVAVYNSSCQNGQSTAGNFCEQFSSAIAANGGNTDGIGQFMMNCYVNPNSAGCEGF